MLTKCNKIIRLEKQLAAETENQKGIQAIPR